MRRGAEGVDEVESRVGPPPSKRRRIETSASGHASASSGVRPPLAYDMTFATLSEVAPRPRHVDHLPTSFGSVAAVPSLGRSDPAALEAGDDDDDRSVAPTELDDGPAWQPPINCSFVIGETSAPPKPPELMGPPNVPRSKLTAARPPSCQGCLLKRITVRCLASEPS